MPRYKKAESEQIKEESRRKLIAAAVAEFAEHGYAGANINRLSRAAGFAQGTVYNYFPTKQALFEAVVGEIAGQHSALILQAAASARSPAGRLERFFSAGFSFAQGFPAAAQIIAAALYGADAEIRALVYRAYEQLLAYVEEEIVQAGQIEGHFRRLDPHLAACAIFALYVSGCAPGPESEPLRRNPKAVAGLVLEGMGRRET